MGWSWLARGAIDQTARGYVRNDLVRPLWSPLHNMAYGKQLNGAENERQAAASPSALWATPWVRHR